VFMAVRRHTTSAWSETTPTGSTMTASS